MIRFVLAFIIAAVATLLIIAGQAKAHGWYDGECCDEEDCRQTTLGEVELRDNGWFVVPLKVIVPFSDDRIRHSLDPLIHICLIPGNKPRLRCLYIPDPSF